MDIPTKFDQMVAKAFEKWKMPVTLEIQEKNIIWVIYGHEEVEFTRDEVRYILTKIHPDILFSETKNGDRTTYEDKPLDSTIEGVQWKLWRILFIDNTKQKYKQVVWYILSKTPTFKKITPSETA